MASSGEGLTALLKRIRLAGQGSFLTVLKRFGAQQDVFSFPMEGFTLAMDFPVNRKTLEMAKDLESLVLDHGGRIYLAKDALMSAETFHRSDSRAAEYKHFREERGLSDAFASAQSKRLDL